jgi:hypothetical protein
VPDVPEVPDSPELSVEPDLLDFFDLCFFALVSAPAVVEPAPVPDIEVECLCLRDFLLLDAWDGAIVSLLGSGSRTIFPSFSPDGRMMAFISDQTGKFEAYVAVWNGERIEGQPLLISSGSLGSVPMWGRDGKHVYFVLEDGGEGRRVQLRSLFRGPARASSKHRLPVVR